MKYFVLSCTLALFSDLTGALAVRLQAAVPRVDVDEHCPQDDDRVVQMMFREIPYTDFVLQPGQI